jgi:toxin ParE1/3/4
MKFKILWSYDAKSDLIEIITYIKERSGSEIARKIYNKVRNQIGKIILYPESFRAVPELLDIGVTEIKELVESPWRIFFRIDNNEIKILTILDGRRNIEEILYKKMIDGKLI